MNKNKFYYDSRKRNNKNDFFYEAKLNKFIYKSPVNTLENQKSIEEPPKKEPVKEIEDKKEKPKQETRTVKKENRNKFYYQAPDDNSDEPSQKTKRIRNNNKFYYRPKPSNKFVYIQKQT